MNMRRLQLIIALLVASNTTASSQTSGPCSEPRTKLGTSLSVGIFAVENAQNPRAIWTWCFHNETSRKMVYLKYGYSDVEGDHTDYFPGDLAAGKGFGGWAAFTSTGRPIRFWIIEIKFEGDEGAQQAAQQPDVQRRRAQSADSILAADVREQAEAQRRQRQLADSIQMARAREASDSSQRAQRLALQARARERAAILEAAQASQGKTQDAVASFAETADALDQGALLKGTTWYYTLSLGLGFFSTPVMVDYAGGNQPASSSPGSAFSGGLAMETAFWPVYGRYFGVGIFGSGMLGLMSSADATTSSAGSAFGYGAKIYAGLSGLAPVVEFGTQSRTATTSTDLASYGSNFQSSGSADYSAARLGYGVRFGRADGSNVELMQFTEKPVFAQSGVATNQPSVKLSAAVYRVRFELGLIGIEGQYGPKYPIAGSTNTPVVANTSAGSYTSVSLYFNYRLFGQPYKGAK